MTHLQNRHNGNMGVSDLAAASFPLLISGMDLVDLAGEAGVAFLS